jgi:hypothetical protein
MDDRGPDNQGMHRITDESGSRCCSVLGHGMKVRILLLIPIVCGIVAAVAYVLQGGFRHDTGFVVFFFGLPSIFLAYPLAFLTDAIPFSEMRPDPMAQAAWQLWWFILFVLVPACANYGLMRGIVWVLNRVLNRSRLADKGSPNTASQATSGSAPGAAPSAPEG